jgi:hypothetical protein
MKLGDYSWQNEVSRLVFEADRLSSSSASLLSEYCRSATTPSRTMSDLERKYGYLWDGSDEGWVLLRAPELPGGYCVFNKKRMVLLHVDSGDLNMRPCERMREAACEALEDQRKGPEVQVQRR